MKASYSVVAVTAGLTLLVCATLSARTITVDDDSPADFNNIQAAIDDTNDGDTVLVQPGTYTGPGNRDIDFLGKAITVRSIDPNDWAVVEATIVDCNNLGRGFQFTTAESQFTVLDGLTIARGWHLEGGAIQCLGTAPTIDHCLFVENHSDLGGAIYVGNTLAGPTINNCRFVGNIANSGASICIWGTVDHSSNPRTPPVASLMSARTTIVTGCVFDGNRATYDGGAFYGWISQFALEQCTFTRNIAENGGAIFVALSEGTLTNLLVTGNRSWSNGGGLYTTNGEPISVTNCTISGNVAGEFGGGMFVFMVNYSELPLSNSIIAQNICPNSDQIAVLEYYYRRLNIEYCNIQGGINGIGAVSGLPHVTWGRGNIETDPLFASPGHWVLPEDSNSTSDANDPNCIWVSGDYHLKSEEGRWDPISENWVLDDSTSPAINTGDPVSDRSLEPAPNGARVNMGAYGNTPEASKSSVSYERTLFVDDDMPADYNNIQSAITDSEHGDTIVIRPGIYTGPGNRNIDFLGRAITVRSVDPNDPAVVASTIIDCSEGPEDPCRAFAFTQGEDANSVLAGLTITNGYDGNGGAIYIARLFIGGSGRDDPPYQWITEAVTCRIINCVFDNCTAATNGGAIYSYDCSPVIEGCVFRNNDSPNGNGGAIAAINYTGTAMSSGGSVTLRNCIFENNIGKSGGAVYGGSTITLDVDNCIFFANSASNSTGSAGGVYSLRTDNIYNCIFWKNSRQNVTDEFAQMTAEPMGGTSYCCIQGWSGGVGGPGNTSADPCFVSPGHFVDPNTPDDANDDYWVPGDYHLKSEIGRWDPAARSWVADDITSLCIDAGDPNTPWINEPWPHGARVNIGLYANTPEASLSPYGGGNCGDYDGNGRVDHNDLAIFASLWLDDAPSLGDINKDSATDLYDYALFADAWPGLFTPGKAHRPTPPPDTNDLPFEGFVLSWEPGAYATIHNIYLGTAEPLDMVVTTVEPNCIISGLYRDTQYFWRVDEENPDGYTTGNTWNFYTSLAPLPAANLTPADGTINIDATGTVLTWTPGEGATSHNVYFGPSNPPPLVTNQTESSYNTGGLSTNTTYYWRIDEVNAGATTTGQTWRFTTRPR